VKIHSIRYNEKDETMLVVHIQDDNGNDVLVLPFYNKASEIEKEKRLIDGINTLPKLLEDIYNEGLKQNKLDFSIEEVDL
jgi:hypothetical protein